MNGFSEAFVPAYQGAASAVAQRSLQEQQGQQQLMRDALLEKQRQAEDDRKKQEMVMDQLAQIGEKPVLRPDGSFDLPGSLGALGRAQRLKEAVSYGIPTMSKPTPAPTPSYSFGGPIPDAPAAPSAPAPRSEADVLGDVRKAKQKEQRQMFTDQVLAKDQGKDLGDFGKYMGRDPAADELTPGGSLAPAAQKVLEGKRDEEAAGKQRAANVAYAHQLVKSAGLDESTPEGQALFNRKLDYLTSDGIKKKAMDQIDSMQSAGLLPNDPQAVAKEQARLMSFGGRPPQLGTQQQKVLDSDAQTLAQTIDLKADVDRFQKQYGVPFTDFTGPFDAAKNQFQFKFTGANTPAEKAAQNIYQRWQGILNQRMFDQSGQAVTAGEQLRQEKAAGNIDFANFPDMLNNFVQMNARSLDNRVSRLGDFAGVDRYAKVKGKPVSEWMGGGGYQDPASGGQAAPGGSWDDAKEKRLQELKAKLGK